MVGENKTQQSSEDILEERVPRVLFQRGRVSGRNNRLVVSKGIPAKSTKHLCSCV